MIENIEVGVYFKQDYGDGETVYTLYISPAFKEGQMNLGYAVLFEPSGYCHLVQGNFDLNLYYNNRKLVESGQEVEILGATSFCSVKSNEISLVREKLREAAKKYDNKEIGK